MKKSLVISIIVTILFSMSSIAQTPNRHGAISLDLDENLLPFLQISRADDQVMGIESGSFTVEAWVHMRGNGGDDFNFFKFRSGNNEFSVAYYGDGRVVNNLPNNWSFESTGAVGLNRQYSYDNNYNAPLFKDNWRHVAITFGETGRLRLYIDGELAISQQVDGIASGFLPNNGPGNSELGGLGRLNGTKGRFYVSEFRLWSVELSQATVQKYYDEEVNVTHPSTQYLRRYYHGNESTGSGLEQRFEDRAAAGEFDARPSRAAITVTSSLTPPLKPPAMGDGRIAISLNASECQNSVDLNWTDLNNSSTFYRYNSNPDYGVNNFVNYRLTRGNQVLYEGPNRSYTDNDVSAGDSHIYNLETYWFVDGIKKISDEKLVSNAGTIPEEYSAVNSFQVSTNKCDATIDLSWSWSGNQPPKWKIERSINSNMANAVTVASINGNIGVYTDNSVNIETNYYYRIAASGNGGNGCPVIGAPSGVINGFTSQPPVSPNDLSVFVDQVNNQFDISWTNPGGNNADGFVLRRENEDGSGVVDIPLGAGITTYTDDQVVICQTYRYKIAATNECSASGVFSNTTQTALLGKDLSNVIAFVEASKGYFSNSVRIEWEINGSLSAVDRFRIERTIAGEDNYQLIKVIDNDLLFDDETASASTLYNYRVTGESTCNDELVYTNEVNDVGFRQPFGIANGHVEYAGGNAVEGVNIIFERQDGVNSGKSLRFDGVNDHVAIDGLTYERSSYTEITVEAWIKTLNSGDQPIISFDRNNYWQLEINGDAADEGKVGWSVQTNTGPLDLGGVTRIDDGAWHHIAAVYNNGVATIYIDGQLDATSTLGTTMGTGTTRFGFIGAESAADVFNGTHGPDLFFDGNLDELRIWSTARTAEEIAGNYNRYINNNVSGLLAYYRCDEGIGSQIYDTSKDGEFFNKHDGTFAEGAGFSSIIPASVQLGVKGTADAFGDFTVGYIPYSGSGNIFRVTPAFGQHEFEPSSRSIYLGDGAQVQNEVDFTDISFFTVNGKVTYKDTNVPVEGASILIDGLEAIGIDNKIVRTDNEGNYEINVPIGNHYLSVEKEGHVFSKGFFPPLDDFGSIVFHEFIEDLTVNFTDSTKVKVAGRVVGGLVEAEKVIGFGKSVNNVGVTTITLDLQNEAYNFPTASVDTDPTSGEYEIELIPEQFILSDILTAGGYIIPSTELSVLDLRNSLNETILVDTTFNSEGVVEAIDTFTYQHNLSFTIRTTPIIEVSDASTGEELRGDSVVYFINQSTGEADTLELGENNPFRFDVYQLGNDYEVEVQLVEQYINPAHPEFGLLTDHVPVEEADITVINNLSVTPGSITGQTNSEGKYLFEFVGGPPSLSMDGANSYTKTLEILASTSSDNITWNEGDVYRGYLLGAQPLDGTDFITYGPEVPEIILHDPPGSNSYAYIEQGSSYTKEEAWSSSDNKESSLDLTLYKGFSIAFGGGLAGPFQEFDFVNDSEKGLEIKRAVSQSGRFSETFTFNERIETSRDPEDVGSNADLYIGKAYNAFISQSTNLKPVTKSFAVDNGLDFIDYADIPSTDDDIVMAFVDGIVIDDSGLETYFIYSQRQLINEIIPDLIALRDDVLINSPNYTSNFPLDNRYWGMSNDDLDIDHLNDSLHAVGIDTANFASYTIDLTGVETYDIQDSVGFLNQQIGVWLGVLALNEADKVNAQLVRNISIDGSTGSIENTISQDITSEYTQNRVNTFNVYGNSNAGFIQSGKGFRLNSRSDFGATFESETGGTITNSVTFGYVIDESDEGDSYSIDVKAADGSGFYGIDEFSEWVADRDDWMNNYVFTSSKTGVKRVAKAAIKKKIGKITSKATARNNAYVSAAFFAIDVGLQIYDAVGLYNFRETVSNKMNDNGAFDISRFGISSPIFTTRGGSTRCPYEDGEETDFYINPNTQATYELHTATIQREVPEINVEPSILTDVPEDEEAIFTLKLQNLSGSSSPMWYDFRIDESTNPDGAILLIDGTDPEQSFLVPFGETLQKTLTIAKGQPDVFEYNDIGLILSSTCQFDPTSDLEVIADTVYVSVSFQPECSSVSIGNLADNWVINHADNNSAQISLEDFDPNLSSLERINFHYQSIGGSPINAAAFFADIASLEYDQFSGPKGPIEGSSLVFDWDVSSLIDRQYQLRATAQCSDGSIFETDFITGTIDRVTPVPFGTPEPSDGILGPGEDISMRFNESIETGLVKGFNMSVTGVLNGADVSHNTSIGFDGVDDYASVNGISLNNKSFTIEYWLQREIGATGTVFSKGVDDAQIGWSFDAGGNINLAFGGNNYLIDPSSFYTVVFPEDAWQHWAMSYNRESHALKVYLNDGLIFEQSSVAFVSADIETAFLGQNVSGTNFLAGSIHEFRIWEDVRSFGEIIANMSVTLSGKELGLYGYWPLDEGTGNLALDKASGRNMNAYGTWVLRPGGVAFDFDGTSQHLAFNGQNVIIDDQTDLTIEFWFKAALPSANVSLFSNGLGDGVEVFSDPKLAMNIYGTSAGQIHVLNNGFDFTATEENYFDDEWHHFAFTIDRRSNAKSYVDGVLQRQSASFNFSQLAGTNMWLGTRAKLTDPITTDFDQYFQGRMDEFRIWNTARKQDHIDLYANTKLAGDEVGLVAYYPFEEYVDVLGAIIMQESLEDQLISDLLITGSLATANAGETYSQPGEAAAIKDVRSVQGIPFTFTVSDEEILITPIVDANRIEGQVIEITIQDIQDLFGNKMSSPASWIAFIEQNEVVWQESNIELIKLTGEALSFTVGVANLGGIPYEYNLENLPAWLSTSQEFGVIQPNSILEIVFEVNEGLNVGSYQQGINLSTALDFDERLNVNIRVMEAAPEWTINPEDFQLTMNIFGNPIIENVSSTDEFDRVAAFVNGEIRGVANVQYIEELDDYQIFLNVYSNEVSGETIEFQIWDASTGKVHVKVTPQLAFEPNGIVGNALNPQDIVADDQISTTLNLKAGWTWVSMNLQSDNLNSVDATLNGIGATGDIIKSQTFFDQYDDVTGWVGTITANGGIQPESLYKVKLTEAAELTIKGTPINPGDAPISFVEGWNYLGFIPEENMTVEEALATMNPQDGDLVKNINLFAIYSGALGWIGSLQTLRPTEGYMLFTSTSGNIIYPRQSSLASGRSMINKNYDIPEEWLIEPAHFANNMSVIAHIENASDLSLTGSEVLLAFSGNESRGYISPTKMPNGDKVYFLTTMGEQDDINLTFKLYNETTGQEVEIVEEITFKADAILGSPKAPISLNGRTALVAGIEDELDEQLTLYPNPITDLLRVKLALEVPDREVTIKIHSLVGTTIETKTLNTDGYGSLKTELSLLELSSGTYVLSVVSGDYREERLIVKE
ncbi:MAG: LamG-like jellyroll fold domain-containing protein [Reichenbachiella sp.]|uniref:LamG-like jellyroll fold domain-containing protein n=1 Tax=Reichenbachiella sp. TaxID=2184521 RepID=UPI00326369EC